jgi:L-malate glycosyltransferase
MVPEWHPWPETPNEGSWGREQTAAVAALHDVATLTTRPGSRALRPRYELSDEIEDGVRTVRVRYSSSPLPKLTTLVRLRAMLLGARKLERSGFKPDIVHAKVFSAGFLALFLARRFHVPLVLSEHYTGFPRGTLSWWDRLIARITFTRADVVCPDSADLGAHLRALARTARIRPMPNVVDTAAFAPAAAEPRAEPRRLVNVASLDDKKGHEYLLEAFAKLVPEYRDLRLAIVGGGSRRTELEALAGRLGVRERTRFLGAQPKDAVAELLREADVFVLSSLWENAPHVVIEALATGTPVVATDVGGVSELVTDADGVLVSAGDPAALAAGIREVFAAYGRYVPHELARRARERFGHERVGRLWSDLYREVRESRAHARDATRR